MPALLSTIRESLGHPPSSAVPQPSATGVASSSSAPPPILVEDSGSESDVQTLAVPFRSGNSDTFLPMLSTDDSWITDVDFR